MTSKIANNEGIRNKAQADIASPIEQFLIRGFDGALDAVAASRGVSLPNQGTTSNFVEQTPPLDNPPIDRQSRPQAFGQNGGAMAQNPLILLAVVAAGVWILAQATD